MALDDILSFIDRLEAFDAQEEQVLIVEANASELEKLQRAQLAQGVDITGQPRIDYYSEPYAKLKEKKYIGLGAKVDRVTFYATGTMYEDLKAEVNSEGFIVETQLPTFDFMTKRIGYANYGLSPESCQIFATEITLPGILQAFETKVIS